MNSKDFRKYGKELVDWIADYFENIEDYPVKARVEPRETYDKLPPAPPDAPEDFERIFEDFKEIILPGITHWEHPRFHAYFPANNSFPSILGEFLTAALGAQCMVWETSPAAAEVEERTMNWLRNLIGLPENFAGVIQDSASSATLCSILTAREIKTNYLTNEKGLYPNKNMRVYCSTQTHSSIDKAVKIAGIGEENVVKIPVNSKFEMKANELERSIQKDLELGYKPLCVIATIGTTSSTAVDPVKRIGEIAGKYDVWLHIDAAFAGTALILPEYKKYAEGLELADTFVFNPHKWMFTNFDCSAYFVKDKEALIRTFAILPEYLKTAVDEKVNNYRDWSVQLGRRFRALKLWFVLRSFGVQGIKDKLRYHLELANNLKLKIEARSDFEILAPVNFNLICFRYKPKGVRDEDKLNQINEDLLKRINDTGKLYLTHTKLGSKYVLRIVIGQTYVKGSDVEKSWEEILKQSGGII